MAENRSMTGKVRKPDRVALAVLQVLAELRPGTVEWCSWLPPSFAADLLSDPRFSGAPSLLESWKDLGNPIRAEQCASMFGIAGESVDFIDVTGVFDFLYPMEAALGAIYNALRPGGVALVGIKKNRLSADNRPPEVGYVADNSAYDLPPGSRLTSMRVGRDWLKGFLHERSAIVKVLEGENDTQLFVIRKPKRPT